MADGRDGRGGADEDSALPLLPGDVWVGGVSVTPSVLCRRVSRCSLAT